MARKRLTPNQRKWKNLIESRTNMAVTSFPTYITQDMLTTLEIDLTEREKNAVNRDDVYIRELQSKLRYYSASIHPVTRYVVSELNEMTANMLAAYGRERVATMLRQAAEAGWEVQEWWFTDSDYRRVSNDLLNFLENVIRYLPNVVITDLNNIINNMVWRMFMKIREYTRFACDFETTVYDGQDTTLVWSAAFAELFKNDVHVLGSIDDFFKYFFENTAGNIILYFHNLKFDGSFILHYFLSNDEFKQALNGDEFLKDSHMKNNTYKYTISNQGQWYSIILKQGNRMIEIRDSLKLLPFSLRSIGESFETDHKKLEMEYKGFRYPNCPITDEERHYIENDVLVLKEALEIAEEKKLDLVLVAPNSKPPVCKIMNYGKYKFEQAKKEKEAKKKQKTVEVKEIRITPNIEEHDFGFKAKNARKFIEDGNKVKITVRFKGREVNNSKLGEDVLNKFIENLEDIASVDKKPKLEGRNMFIMLSKKA